MEQTLTHWKKLTNTEYLGSYALQPGEELIVTIKDFKQDNVVGMNGSKELKTVVTFVENVKPMVLNRTNAKTITKLFGTHYMEQWKGRQIQIFVENGIKAFGEIVDGIRVRPFLPKVDKPICEECGKELVPINGRSPQALAQYTQKNYHKVLCSECAMKAKAAKEAENGSDS